MKTAISTRIMKGLLFTGLPVVCCLANTGKEIPPVKAIICLEEGFISKAISYTPSGELSSVVQTGDSCVYEYAGNSIRLHRYFSEDNSSVLQIYHTDDLGRIITEEVYDHDSLPLARSGFTYNGDGFLSAIESVKHRSGVTFRFLFTYAEGDLVTMEILLNNAPLRSFHYHYDTGKKNRPSITQEIPGFPVFSLKQGHSPFGKSSAHLLREKVIVEANRDTTGHQQYDHLIAEDGRLIRQVVKDLRYGKLLHFEYKY